ncbi:MAG: N4-gp56 family major capsid protein [Clostridia bacterium]|jgi:N4-gp56 family major capsid protein|nr:N4-gp56 family major capsid protein [Clostridia bacterium]MBQ6234953.1 N4-gp56 family major capsid protein [Clostridia bacterium]MBR0436903.1 N4-gp56 family major capsid protein [Clostridia bacterium]MBR2644101.1 N4-gp56 family major capsid protein [Clostridia bacterium]MBR3037213.1 N4-gp56 family major capsid protein [Clostridia bacterium]
MNTTINTANTAYFNKQFYDKKLLETAKTRLVHAEFGQKRSIPRHGGKRVEFRKYDLFTPDVASLTLEEGITPAGQVLSQSKVEAEVAQYGAYVEISDLLDMTAYDEVIADSAELLGEQLGTVIEWVTRDAMCATTNVQYANGKEDRSEIGSEDVLTVTEIRKAVRTLKKNKARMFNTASDGSVRRPHFVCICSPDATYDLQNDPLWQDVSKYSNAEQIYSGEIGRLFGVVFVEATEAKVYRQSFYNRAKTAGTNTNSIELKTVPSDREKAYLVAGNVITINGSEYEITAYNAETNVLTIDTAITYRINDPVYTTDAGEESGTHKQADVHATLVFGADAYGVIDIDGSGTIETIIKPCGSEGSADPLNQRSTVGAKVAAYAAKVLNPLWIVRIEHGVSE